MRIIERIKLLARGESRGDINRLSKLGHFDKWTYDRESAWDYFLDTYVKKCFQEYFEKNKNVYHLDIAGRANFGNLVSKTFHFVRSSLGKSNSSQVEYFVGDILEDKDFLEMINEIKGQNILVDLVTFVPVGALAEYAPQEVEYLSSKQNEEMLDVNTIENELFKIFIKRTRQVSEIMKVGGLFFVGESYPLEYYYLNFPETFTNLFRKVGFEVLVSPRARVPEFLLKKIK